MKTYGIGVHHVRVYERRDTRPSDAMRAVADGCKICFVDRVVDGGGAIDTDAMTEALVRHRRLKVGMVGPFELGTIETFSEASASLSGRLKAWTRRLADAGAHRLHLGEGPPPA
jgi:hypothetical protein